jgi:hypothetical protein
LDSDWTLWGSGTGRRRVRATLGDDIGDFGRRLSQLSREFEELERRVRANDDASARLAELQKLLAART